MINLIILKYIIVINNKANEMLLLIPKLNFIYIKFWPYCLLAYYLV